MQADIKITSDIYEKCPMLQLGCFSAHLNIHPTSGALKSFIDRETERLSTQFELQTVSKRPTIQATREAYKALGKKPGRYRPSAEALLRRVISGKGLYQINNAIDLLNVISLKTGFSIGGYDFGQIEGSIQLGIGQKGEPYQAIARGELNIANLPVFRDDLGAFGSPTSDSDRTSITDATQIFLMVIFDFEPTGTLPNLLEQVADWYQQYCQAENSSFWIQHYEST